MAVGLNFQWQEPAFALIANIIGMFILVYVVNFFDQKKARKALKSKFSFSYRPSFNDWNSFIRKHKRYSILMYFIVFGVIGLGVYLVNFEIIIFGMAFAIWKYVSLNWPVTFIYTTKGIYTWDPLQLYDRIKTEDLYEWMDIDYLIIEEEHNKITLVFRNRLYHEHCLNNVNVNALCDWLDKQGIRYERFQHINDGKVRKASFQV